MWILAAKWEFEDNSNITSARVLLQRAIRLNSDSRHLWLEYFKLELMWIEKIKERRRILFGADDTLLLAAAPSDTENEQQYQNSTSKPSETDEGQHAETQSDNTAHVFVPPLDEESELSDSKQSYVDEDTTLNNKATTSTTAQDPAMMMGKNLSPMQKTLLELAIPRAIYRNAIKGDFFSFSSKITILMFSFLLSISIHSKYSGPIL